MLRSARKLHRNETGGPGSTRIVISLVPVRFDFHDLSEVRCIHHETFHLETDLLYVGDAVKVFVLDATSAASRGFSGVPQPSIEPRIVPAQYREQLLET
jgi:hypothetical protein